MSPANSPHPDDGPVPLSQMELAISYVLRGGVLLSAGVILVGILLFAVTRGTGYARLLPHHLQDLLTYHAGNGPGFFPTRPAAVLMGSLAGKPFAIIGLGIMLLIATPVMRVALSAFFFLAQRDWLYVAITLFVLAVLGLSLLSGIG